MRDSFLKFPESAEETAKTAHGLYLFPLLFRPLLPVMAIGNVCLGVLMMGSVSLVHLAYIPVFTVVGALVSLFGFWMRRVLQARNPLAWRVHAVLGPLFLAIALLMMLAFMYGHTDSARQALSNLPKTALSVFSIASMVLFYGYMMLWGIQLQNAWMSEETKAWFGFSSPGGEADL